MTRDRLHRVQMTLESEVIQKQHIVVVTATSSTGPLQVNLRQTLVLGMLHLGHVVSPLRVLKLTSRECFRGQYTHPISYNAGVCLCFLGCTGFQSDVKINTSYTIFCCIYVIAHIRPRIRDRSEETAPMRGRPCGHVKGSLTMFTTFLLPFKLRETGRFCYTSEKLWKNHGVREIGVAVNSTFSCGM